jgi:hypothetical protein
MIRSLSALRLTPYKSFLSKFNIHNLCRTLRSLVLLFQTTNERFSKIMAVLGAVVVGFYISI